MKVLVTGFEPFGGEKINPTERIAKDLDGIKIGDAQVFGRVLPVVFGKAKEVLEKTLEEIKPDIAIHVGLAPGRSAISIERIAVNAIDARIPDNEGKKIEDEPIVPGAPTAYFSTLPIKKIMKKLHERGIPAYISNSAGLYLSNYVMYLSLHHSATKGYPKMSGFIHVPYIPEQIIDKIGKGQVPPSMSYEMELEAVKVPIEVALEELL
uniref:Pyrrolidone-carboxylate peptidase n=1 Tax=Pyrococcus furiosus TaxID=2261 RepID=UPI00017533BF|nr:Chain A, Pyrrolidone-carboxylate peptidase [Pyrococcus furiosus]2EO8_B Chain B, Pyrrolidone-carboxylate peptidase [Pyrococcus furiosus]2EO8_C Chain C, Pyrrolidone-carboxylate peptidase [Pyrococcus furiosus]2EO8_D Chain D, Pyrrolidone-carboxylate peptidase [Pyrococcus furiosus]